MVFKGKYLQRYSVDNESKELIVKVELKLTKEYHVQFQNLYYGEATVNGKVVNHEDLPYCVNAEYMAEIIGLEVIESWKIRAKKQGKIFKLEKK